jgi:hypothetical protein
MQISIYDLQKNHVIANEVKQSYKSKFRLLCRFTPRNDNDELSGIDKNIGLPLQISIYDLQLTIYALYSTLTSILSLPTPRLRQAGRRGRGRKKIDIICKRYVLAFVKTL